ncbi:hypothetical protein BI350_07920 [Sporosarcina ureilytica]|uniref:Uncharacterized protein n=1 Tax=Sporosarcina ureilytica TaxID=298596 RepID=A0A1D8JFK0_9BACL|nr:hypothetical protein BI350_07920 [Sporosarcina ureilytica]
MFGCDMTNENPEDTNEGVNIDKEEGGISGNKEQSNPNDNESIMALNTGSTETVINKVEGMDVEVKVINYVIQPYDISYQLNETFDNPEVKQNQVIYSTQNDEYNITLEIHTNLENAISNLQESFIAEAYEEKGELESTPIEENDLKGEMQFFAYKIDEHVLVITYQYPVEAGDGMYPLLEALRNSIHVQKFFVIYVFGNLKFRWM